MTNTYCPVVSVCSSVCVLLVCSCPFLCAVLVSIKLGWDWWAPPSSLLGCWVSGWLSLTYHIPVRPQTHATPSLLSPGARTLQLNMRETKNINLFIFFTDITVLGVEVQLFFKVKCKLKENNILTWKTTHVVTSSFNCAVEYFVWQRQSTEFERSKAKHVYLCSAIQTQGNTQCFTGA